MRNIWLPLMVGLPLFASAGCDALNKVKSENPVFPAAPPRLSSSNEQPPGGRGTAVASRADDKGDGKSGPPGEPPVKSPRDNLQTVGLKAGQPGVGADDGPELSESEVVATVNGQPIFASEVLDRYATQLAQAKKSAPPVEFRKLREFLIRRDLPGHIERKILVQNLRATLKPEQLKILGKALDQQFDSEIERMMKQMKAANRAELEEELAKQQTTIETLRTTFLNQRMAMEYLAAKSKYDKKIGRRELHDYYDAHVSEYSFPAEVKWQQILVSYEKHGGKDEAYRKALRKAIDELKSGAEFAEVAKKYSDGPTAGDGGHRDWMPRGSLDDTTIEEALFELPVGPVSQVFIGERGFQLVKVVARRDAGKTPFEELQDDIRQKVEMEARKEASQRFLKELKKKAMIESPFLEREEDRKSADPLPFN